MPADPRDQFLIFDVVSSLILMITSNCMLLTHTHVSPAQSSLQTCRLTELPAFSKLVLRYLTAPQTQHVHTWKPDLPRSQILLHLVFPISVDSNSIVPVAQPKTVGLFSGCSLFFHIPYEICQQMALILKQVQKLFHTTSTSWSRPPLSPIWITLIKCSIFFPPPYLHLKHNCQSDPAKPWVRSCYFACFSHTSASNSFLYLKFLQWLQRSQCPPLHPASLTAASTTLSVYHCVAAMLAFCQPHAHLSKHWLQHHYAKFLHG